MQEKEKTEISYSAFMEILKERLQEHYGSEYVLEECGVVRNNDITRAGLIIRKSGNSFAPVFHTEDYYEQYRNGEILDNVMKRIICLQKQYEEEGEIGMSVTDGQLWDFEQNRDKICVRLVNAKRNEHNLQVCVHKKFLDLALEYYVVCYRE